MKILLLGDINSGHLIKWARSLSLEGFQIGIYSLSVPESDWYSAYPGITVFSKQEKTGQNFFKFLKSILEVRRIIHRWQPENVNAHYATSYGLLGALSFYNPYYISVYGSDVFEFPKKSFIHKMLLSFNFSRAAKLFSSSQIMALEIKKYTQKEVEIIPFGIDTDLFYPTPSAEKNNDLLVIGCIKSLEKIYAIDIAIKAFAELKKWRPELNLQLQIFGSGNEEASLKALVKELAIEKYTIFKGKIPFDGIAKAHNEIGIFLNLSVHESFGVSVLEAMACEKPVIVTNTGGLKEIVTEACGIFVPVNDYIATAKALSTLADNKSLREEMGKAGRERVKMNYNWKENVKKMSYYYNLSIK